MTELTSIETQSLLSQYAEIRWQMACLEAKLKEIEPMAIEEALSIIDAQKTANGKQVVHRTDTVDITVQFRTHKPKPQDHPDLETLQEWIQIESEKAQHKNADKIAKVKGEIAALEAHLIGLMQTDDGLEWTAEYQELVSKLTTKKPILAVKLK